MYMSRPSTRDLFCSKAASFRALCPGGKRNEPQPVLSGGSLEIDGTRVKFVRADGHVNISNNLGLFRGTMSLSQNDYLKKN